MILELTDPVYLCGDIHGDTAGLKATIEILDLRDCTIILLGDVGIFRYRDYKRYRTLDSLCSDRNIMVYAIRGNHDNPGFFSEFVTDISERFWNKFTNFKPVHDHAKIKYKGKIGYVISGATSRDRCLRKNFQRTYVDFNNLYRGGDWWPKEAIKVMQADDADFILSHIGPLNSDMQIDIPGKFIEMDPYLESELKLEQQLLHNMLNYMQPKRWYFGHYHVNKNYLINNTKCIILGINTLTKMHLD